MKPPLYRFMVREFFAGMFEPFAGGAGFVFLLFMLAACGLTVAQRSAITSAEAALCPELVALTGLPPGFEASACVAVEGATAAIPTSEAAVRAAVSAAPVSPRPVERPVPGHGRYLDRRAVMAVTPNK